MEYPREQHVGVGGAGGGGAVDVDDGGPGGAGVGGVVQGAAALQQLAFVIEHGGGVGGVPVVVEPDRGQAAVAGGVEVVHLGGVAGMEDLAVGRQVQVRQPVLGFGPGGLAEDARLQVDAVQVGPAGAGGPEFGDGAAGLAEGGEHLPVGQGDGAVVPAPHRHVLDAGPALGLVVEGAGAPGRRGGVAGVAAGHEHAAVLEHDGDAAKQGVGVVVGVGELAGGRVPDGGVGVGAAVEAARVVAAPGEDPPVREVGRGGEGERPRGQGPPLAVQRRVAADGGVGLGHGDGVHQLGHPGAHGDGRQAGVEVTAHRLGGARLPRPGLGGQVGVLLLVRRQAMPRVAMACTGQQANKEK